MKHKLIIITFLTLHGIKESLGNGGEHGHGDHGHHHHHHHGSEGGGGEDLEDLIKNFGIAVLGKDQESADDVSPTADHSHVNIKALINELFHPSTTSTTTTTTPLTTSTQRLPIKAHDIGWELSPIDLVMSNSILEPVFSAEQQRQSRKLGPTYLTETPYLARDDAELTGTIAHPPTASGKLKHLKMNLDPEQLIDKPTLPVLDTRRANFLLVHGRRRSKTGRKLKNKKSSKLHQKIHDQDDILWRETVSEHEDFSGAIELSDKTSHNHHSDKKCVHDKDDILWRETVSHQNFITTSPHTFVPSDVTTVTPLMDLSRFLVPPTTSDNSGHSDTDQDNNDKLIQSALSQVTSDVTAAARKHPQNSNKKGSAMRLRSSNARHVTHINRQENISQRNHVTHVRDDNSRNVEQANTDDFGRSQVFQQTSIVRRGKKSDDNQESNHDVHEHLRDDEVEDIIFRDDSQQPHSTFNADFADKISHSHVTSGEEGFKSNFDSKAGLRKSFNKHTSSNTINDIHTTQDKHIHHKMMMTVTRAGDNRMDCHGKQEGLHADVSSGCQRFFMCHENGRSGRFSCPVGTLFSEKLGVCDWAKRVKC